MEFDIGRYFKDISRYKVLSHEEQTELAKRIKKGSKEAVQKLITSNLRFVVTIAKKYAAYGVPISDLIQEGNLGLLEAAKKYDHTKGYHFTSYAVWWIRQKIVRAVCDKSRIIRLPANRNDLLGRIREAEKVLSIKNNGKPSLSDISEYLEVPPIELSEALIADDVRSLDDYSPEHPNSSMMFHDKHENPEKNVEIILLREDLRSAVTSSLNNQEADIILRRFGLNGSSRQETLDEVSKSYRVSKERIRQIQKKALKRLRENPYVLEKLSPYLKLI